MKNEVLSSKVSFGKFKWSYYENNPVGEQQLCILFSIHLIQKRLSSELLHCTLRIVAYPDRKAPWM